MRKITKGQSSAEYAVILSLVVAAVIGMQVYVKRGLQARVKAGTDAFVTAGRISSSRLQTAPQG